MTQDMAKLERVRQWVETEFVRNPNETPFSVGIGLVEKDGVETGEVGVIVKVETKMSARALRADDKNPLPTEIDGVRIDVQQAPMPTDQRLRLEDMEFTGLSLVPQGPVGVHQSCLNCPIPGGAQIAPAQPWVGTLGGALRWKKPDGSYAYGAVTNAHVTGMNAEGKPMFQPSQRGDWFGKVHKVVDLKFDNTANGIDAAVIDCFRPADGKYAGKIGGTVKPEQIDFGRINPKPVRATLRMEVRKTGRTTGSVDGRCVQINNTTSVRYEEGLALFRGQDVFREPNGGQFSAGGDSGSLILTRDNRPVSLLFAGGGLDTIGCPIEWVLQFFGAEFY